MNTHPPTGTLRGGEKPAAIVEPHPPMRDGGTVTGEYVRYKQAQSCRIVYIVGRG